MNGYRVTVSNGIYTRSLKAADFLRFPVLSIAFDVSSLGEAKAKGAHALRCIVDKRQVMR